MSVAGLQHDESGRAIPPWEVEPNPAASYRPTFLTAEWATSLTTEERLAVLEEAVVFLHAANQELRTMVYSVGRER